MRVREAPSDTRTEISRAREQQVGDVGARDEQHERDGAHERQEDDTNLAAVDTLVVRLHDGADVLVRIRIFRRQSRRDGVDLGLRLLLRHARREPRNQVEAARVPRLFEQVGHRGERLPQFRIAREAEPFGHDADHDDGNFVDTDRAADHARIAAVAILKHAAGEQHHGRGAGLVVFGCEVAPERGPLSEQLESVA
jgi:hypothetical protein